MAMEAMYQATSGAAIGGLDLTPEHLWPIQGDDESPTDWGTRHSS